MSPSFPGRYAIAVAAVTSFFIATIVVVTAEWLQPEHKLVAQILLYGSTALISALLYRGMLQTADASAIFNGRRIAVILLLLALAVVVVRFVIKYPPADWGTINPAEWTLIGQAYLVGRLLVPLSEEILFRGLLWSTIQPLETGRWRLSPATLITAAIFGALHWPGLYGLPIEGGMTLVLSAFAGGLVFGVLRERTGTIAFGLALHIIGNSVGF